MSQAWIVTVGAAPLATGEDPAGLLVVRALLADGVPVASRQLVDEEEAAVEEALRGARAAASLVVVLAHPGGSSGEVVRRALSRLTGARLTLNDKLLAALEEDHARRGQAMPRRLDRLALVPQGAVLWPAPGEPAWMLESGHAAIAVLPRALPGWPPSSTSTSGPWPASAPAAGSTPCCAGCTPPGSRWPTRRSGSAGGSARKGR